MSFDIMKEAWRKKGLTMTPEQESYCKMGWDAAVEVCKMEKVEREETQRRGDTDIKFLIERIDAIHDALCPGQMGTWQDRANQAMASAVEISKSRTLGEFQVAVNTEVYEEGSCHPLCGLWYGKGKKLKPCCRAKLSYYRTKDGCLYQYPGKNCPRGKHET